MNEKRLKEILSGFSEKKIAVVGDFFLDKYLFFDRQWEEVSIETGKVANQVTLIKHSPGAAGNIVKNIVSLGAGEVVPVGFTGDDGEGYELRMDLEEMGCRTDYLAKSRKRYTPTYMKPQNIDIVGLRGENERYDIKNHDTLLPEIEDEIIKNIKEVVPKMDAVVVADQVELKKPDCGTVTKRVRETLVEMAEKYPNIVFWVDSRMRMMLFENMVLKPNQEEGCKAVFGDNAEINPENTQKAGEELLKHSKRGVFLTCGADGVRVFDKKGSAMCPAVKLDCELDTTGAGDSFTSGAILALVSGADYEEAAQIGNLTSGVTVQMLGTTGQATRDDLVRLFNQNL
ncbi:MAG: carbohydrate kinase [Armatimonadetes bacterium]|nr:carbohydrate kinase [Candidatus Hippobium faecium]